MHRAAFASKRVKLMDRLIHDDLSVKYIQTDDTIFSQSHITTTILCQS